MGDDCFRFMSLPSLLAPFPLSLFPSSEQVVNLGLKLPRYDRREPSFGRRVEIAIWPREDSSQDEENLGTRPQERTTRNQREILDGAGRECISPVSPFFLGSLFLGLSEPLRTEKI